MYINLFFIINYYNTTKTVHYLPLYLHSNSALCCCCVSAVCVRHWALSLQRTARCWASVNLESETEYRMKPTRHGTRQHSCSPSFLLTVTSTPSSKKAAHNAGHIWHRVISFSSYASCQPACDETCVTRSQAAPVLRVRITNRAITNLLPGTN